ncbi:MAG: ABC transporter substrate-binding protein, partial [Bifidobacteriaceae bacterium]|nr:ABC transporter substrate-binding protein [Bifidobacteriaceae bacterium]
TLALAAAGCNGSDPEPGKTNATNTETSTDKGTLTLGVVGELQSGGWDPASQPRYQNYPWMAAWDTIIRTDEFGKPTPGFAESFEFSDDNKSVTFHLRQGKKFSDGNPITAETIKEIAEWIQTTPNAERFAGLVYDIPDEYTITLTWPTAVPTLPVVVQDITLFSPAWEATGDFDAPVGYGPYILDEALTTAGSVYTFNKNPEHWDADNFPYETLVVKLMDSETAVLNALKTEQLDGALVSASSYDEVTGAGLETIALRGNTTRLLITDHLGEKIPALGHVEVRQAMNMVFDKQAMVDQIYNGHGEVASQIFRPGSDAFIENFEDPYPYDVDKAKELMAQAGFADGFDLEIPTMAGTGLDTLMPYVTQQLGLINIRVTEAPLTGPNAIADLLSGDYPVPMWQLGNYGESLQDIRDYLLDDGIWNVEHQKDAKITAWWEQILSGEGEKAAIQKEMNQYIIDEAWFVPMVYPDMFFAHASRISIPLVTDYSGLNPMLWDFK